MCAALAAVVALGATSGCGDDPPSRKEYVARADRICAGYKARTKPLLTEKGVPEKEVARHAKVLVPEFEKTVAALRALPVPEGLGQEIRSFLTVQDQTAALLRRMATGRRMAANFAESERLDNRSFALGDKIGYSQCWILGVFSDALPPLHPP